MPVESDKTSENVNLVCYYSRGISRVMQTSRKKMREKDKNETTFDSKIVEKGQCTCTFLTRLPSVFKFSQSKFMFNKHGLLCTNLCALALLGLTIFSAESDETAFSFFWILGDAESKRLGCGGSVEGHRDSGNTRGRIGQTSIVVNTATNANAVRKFGRRNIFAAGGVAGCATLETTSVTQTTAGWHNDRRIGTGCCHRRCSSCRLFKRLIMCRWAFLMMIIIPSSSWSENISEMAKWSENCMINSWNRFARHSRLFVSNSSFSIPRQVTRHPLFHFISASTSIRDDEIYSCDGWARTAGYDIPSHPARNLLGGRSLVMAVENDHRHDHRDGSNRHHSSQINPY